MVIYVATTRNFALSDVSTIAMCAVACLLTANYWRVIYDQNTSTKYDGSNFFRDNGNYMTLHRRIYDYSFMLISAVKVMVNR
eukprot:6209438-Pleurochrysis_carterae.AAC.2